MTNVTHDDTIVGNVYDKYGTSNPIARRLMEGFFGSIDALYARSSPIRVLEVGCGEGHLAQHLIDAHPRPELFEICDITLEQLSPNLDEFLKAREASIYELPFADNSFDLVLCCEVLEHIEDPSAGLAGLARVSSKNVIVSTPREPLWRAMNMARGKYLGDLGNTPGHIQHFSQRGLRKLVASQLELVEVRAPLPWTMILAQVR